MQRLSAMALGVTCLAGMLTTLAAGNEPQADPKQPPQAALTVTATVEGYTQGTMFNMQKYPFKYKGSSALAAEQVKALGKKGDVPADVAKALLSCLLWPKQDERLEKAALKSDGKRLTGEAVVLHKYGKQGKHTLRLRVEGSLEDGRLSLRALEPQVTGMWDYGGGSITLKGEATIKIDIKQ